MEGIKPLRRYREEDRESSIAPIPYSRREPYSHAEAVLHTRADTVLTRRESLSRNRQRSLNHSFTGLSHCLYYPFIGQE